MPARVPFHVALSVARFDSSLSRLPAEIEDLRLRMTLEHAEGQPTDSVSLRLATSALHDAGHARLGGHAARR